MTSPTEDKWLQWAERLDAMRFVPRAVVVFYCYVLLVSTIWYMDLDSPSGSQATFVSVLWGAAAGFFGLYMNTGRRW